MTTNRISMNDYFKAMNDPDEDFAVLELQRIADILERDKTIAIPTHNDEYFLDPIFDAMTREKKELVDVSFRIVVLLVESYEINNLKLIFDRISEKAFSREFMIRPQLLAVCKEILAGRDKYTLERARVIFDILFPDLMRDVTTQQNENQDFVLELMATLLEFYGVFATEVQRRSVIEKIMFLVHQNLSEERMEKVRLITHLTREWSLHASREDVNVLMDGLLKPELVNSMPTFTIMAGIIMFNPKPFGDYVDQLFQIFTNTISEKLHRSTMNSDQSEGESSDIIDEEIDSTDPEVILIVQSSIEALAVLTSALPEKMAKHATDLLSLSYEFIVHNIINSESHTDLSEQDEMDFELGSDVENDDSEINDDQTTEVGGDDSWKLRKSSSMLATALVTACKDVFIESLKNSENVEIIKRSLSDSDRASLKCAVDFVIAIVRNCKNDVEEGIIDSIIQVLIDQVHSNASSTTLVLDSLTLIIKENMGINEELIMGVFSKMGKSPNDSSAIPLLNIIISITLSMECSDYLVDIMSSSCIDIMKFLKGKNFSLSLTAASHIFRIARKSSSLVIQLNKYFVELFVKSDESSSESLIPITIFYLSFPNVETSQKSIDLLMEDVTSDNASKYGIIALTLLCASPRKSIIQNYPNLIVALVKHLEMTDRNLIFKVLWCTDVLLEKGIIEKNKLLISPILKLMKVSGSRIISLSLIILSRIVQSAQEVDEINHNLFPIISRPMEKNVVNAVASYFLQSIKISPENVLKIIFDSLESNEASIPDISVIVGILGASSQEMTDLFLQKLKSGIVDKKPSYIRCLGEIGSRIGSSIDQTLVNDLITFVSPRQHRDIFSAAAHAIGCIASADKTNTLKRLTMYAYAGDDSYPIWLISFDSLTQKLYQNETKETIGTAFDEISGVLLDERKRKEENDEITARSLSTLAKIDNSLIDTLIEKSKERSTSAVIASLAINMFISSSKKEDIGPVMEKVSDLIDTKYPLESCPIVPLFKLSFPLPSDSKLIETVVPKIVECAKFCPEHIIEINLGVQKLEEDIGFEVRCASLETLCAISNRDSAYLEATILCLTDALLDRHTDVKVKAMTLIPGLLIRYPEVISEFINSIVAKTHELASTEENAKPEIEEPFLYLLSTLQYFIPSHPTLEKIIAKCQNTAKFEISKKQTLNAINAANCNKVRETTSLALPQEIMLKNFVPDDAESLLLDQ